MKKMDPSKLYFFVDEAGDPVFYNKYGTCIVGQEGCSKVLLLGFIRTSNPQPLRRAVLSLKDEVSNDRYLEKIPSMRKTLRAFHAKDDCPEVREKFFKLIVDLDFSAEFVVARKIEKVFVERHKRKENIFYDDLLVKLFENKLHRHRQNYIYYAVRGSSERQIPVSEAIQTAILAFENKWKKKVNSKVFIEPQSPVGEPCLQIADYMNWAVQRVFTKNEERYLSFIEKKISFLVDIYDFNKYPRNFYNRKNKFGLTKISPL